ncbi:hypothetical protein NQZ68_008199 [Dissostichus eleginoides]|nr:hypothetical protein NQZ68_008199 [Dissostichus eleginoides]
MSAVPSLREFVNERLTAAAEEILGVFERTIFEYEEEIDRQRRLLNILPTIKLHRIELPQQHVCKEAEVFSEQQLCIQENDSGLDQEDPEPPQIKEEQEELCSSEEQLVLKQETDDFMLTPTYMESDHSEDQTLNLSISDTQQCNVASEEGIVYTNSDPQLLSHNSPLAESQDQKVSKHGDSGSTHAEPETSEGVLRYEVLTTADQDYPTRAAVLEMLCPSRLAITICPLSKSLTSLRLPILPTRQLEDKVFTCYLKYPTH